jgi:hypothetical protein
MRPGLIRLIPMAIVGIGWAANVVIAYLRGSKLLKKGKKRGNG